MMVLKNFFTKIKKSFAQLRLKIFIRLTKIDLFAHIVAWEGLYKFVVKGPKRYRYISQMYLYTHRNMKLRKLMLEELHAHPDCHQTIVSRLRIRKTLEELQKCKKGTLGYLFHQHLTVNKIKLVLPLSTEVKTDFQYVIHRILVTHDIYHTLLAPKTDYYSEALVAGFTNSQIKFYMPPLVHYGAGLLHYMIEKPEILDHGNSGFIIGWMLGKSSNQLFCVDWDKYWDMPLPRVQRLLNINIEGAMKVVNDAKHTNNDKIHLKVVKNG